ncbi:MAG: hypothetical protein KJ043_00780 [Anaerolineae bacterium]|nr:hypothetical protein [Anaerolineae bacterium]
MNGIATTTTSWNAGVSRLVNPPRLVITKLARGATLGRPNDREQQRRVLLTTLNRLNQNAPLEHLTLDETLDP